MRVVVVGAGIVGLSCAWFLQEHGAHVQVVDRAVVAAGASWGNAGYVSPAHCTPLPEPAILRYGLRAVLDPRSPVALPVRGELARARFLAGMARRCTHRSWRASMRAYLPLNDAALAAYDTLAEGGVAARTVAADVLAAFGSDREAAAELAELGRVSASGMRLDVELLTGEQIRAVEPALSPAIRCGLLLRGQRYLHPPEYLAALAGSVRARGGVITEGLSITSVHRRGAAVIAGTGIGTGGELVADAVVLANGVWLGELAAPHGVRTRVQAGRGYSFSLPTATPLARPVRFPATRLALTPFGPRRVRVVGVMEFAGPDRPLDPRRLRSMADALAPLVGGLDWSGRADDWVGPRPLSVDGVPLVGPTATPGVHVAGGHGMWGVTLGPVTGRLLAECIVTGRVPPELVALNPLR